MTVLIFNNLEMKIPAIWSIEHTSNSNLSAHKMLYFKCS